MQDTISKPDIILKIEDFENEINQIEFNKNEINKVLFVPTGALMSPTSVQQGESIAGIAHCVGIEN